MKERKKAGREGGREGGWEGERERREKKRKMKRFPVLNKKSNYLGNTFLNYFYLSIF